MDLISFSSIEAAIQYEQANGRAVQVEITIDGATKKAYEGGWLVDAIVREKAIPPCLLPPTLRPDQDVRYMPGGCQRRVKARLRNRGKRRPECRDGIRRNSQGTARGYGHNPRQSRALLYGLRQQQRKLYRPQYHRTSEPRAPEHSLHAKAV